jgi:hypothetical protein
VARVVHCYDALGFGQATGGDEVFRQLVLARIIEPTSKLDSLRVLDEAEIPTASYPTMNRRLRVYSADRWRERLAAVCARHAGLGLATLVMFDVTTLYFETDAGDGHGCAAHHPTWHSRRHQATVAAIHPWLTWLRSSHSGAAVAELAPAAADVRVRAAVGFVLDDRSSWRRRAARSGIL